VARRARDGHPLRVVVLVDGLGLVGGGERLARLVASHLDPKRFERTLCVSRWSPKEADDPDVAEVLEELRRSKVRFLGLERSSPADLRAWAPLVRALRSGTDVLHAHKFGSNVWGAIWGTVARTPVIVAHEQTWSYEGRPLRRFLDRELIARRSDAFVCVSGEDRRRMIEVEGIDPEKIRLLPNAIPAPAGVGDRNVRRELGIEPGDPVVGTVCVLRPQKALDVLLRSAAVLRREFPRIRVLVVGDGPERRRLESMRAALELEGTVELLGQRSDVPDLIAAFDVAVSSSDYEGTPLAVMEYMAVGLPIVATRVGGVPELIDSGVHGLLVDPREPESLAGSIAELLRDRDAAQQLGERARERQRREFALDVAVERLAALYEGLYAASPRADPARARAVAARRTHEAER
jgi:glycosyltransferase involved in cell wall biosynthesis